MGSPLLGAARLAASLLWTLCLLPFQALAVALDHPLRTRIPLWYHRLNLKLLGLEVQVTGLAETHRPVLFVSNHSSYLDIAVLGSLVRGSFIAKAEVATWPLFGWLAKLQNSVFVDRRSAHASRDLRRVRDRLASGDAMILFPEGTSSDGNRVLPFKTALFAVAEGSALERSLPVQPVSIVGIALDGIPLGRRLRSIYSWYGDMDLFSHLCHMVKQGRLTVAVHFHTPVTLLELGSRKALADHCWQVIALAIADSATGRQPTGGIPGSSQPVPVTT